VPYALKAGEAATVGGLPPSAFVLAASASGSEQAVLDAGVATQTSAAPTNGPVTGLGTVGYIPLWDATSDIVDSALFQSGSGSTVKIGINNATPATTLDVAGSSIVRGTFELPNTGTATAAGGQEFAALRAAGMGLQQFYGQGRDPDLRMAGRTGGQGAANHGRSIELILPSKRLVVYGLLSPNRVREGLPTIRPESRLSIPSESVFSAMSGIAAATPRYNRQPVAGGHRCCK
jgi:hypothetical protein